METVNKQLFENLVETMQGKLTEGLSSIVRQPVELQLGHIGFVPLPEISSYTGKSSLASIYVPLLGDITGDIFLFMGTGEATAMADLMIGNPVGTTTMIGDFEASALKELGNITSGVIVTELANKLQLSIMLTTPNFITDYASAVVDQVLSSYAETSNEAYAIHLPFTVEGHMVSGFFLILLDKSSLDRMNKQLEKLAPAHV